MADWERQESSDSESIESDPVEVRLLTPEDIDWVTRMDEKNSGRNRREYFKVKLAEAAKDTGIRVSLAALLEGMPAGFLMCRLYYGEFGMPEPVAILDTLGVSPEYRRRGVGVAMLRQLMMNINSLGIEKLRTEVEWDDVDLIRFFQRSGFRPAPRLCLEMPVGYPGES